jgi:adenine phosphoribosyltransferase|tara:strand:+ start:102 stop:617 length:516 start_codon:yes stop_codon:yes gene_type:complete
VIDYNDYIDIDYKDYIESVPNFPKDGILYRDIQPLLENRNAFNQAINEMYSLTAIKPDYYVGIESRGFIFASALANKFGKGFKMIRKSGKLPDGNHTLVSTEYDLEYGTDTIEMKPGSGSVIIVDDIFATGGTMEAAENLCKFGGYEILDKICLLDIGIVKEHDVKYLIKY